MKTTLLALALIGFVGCGDDGGAGGGGGGGGADAPVAPTNITISGVSSEVGLSGRTPLAGVAITVFKVSDDSMITTATSDAQGVFTLTAPSDGAAIDGYLKATKATYKDTYLYPPGPLSSDFANVPVLMLTPSTQKLANQLGGALEPDPAKGWIGVLVSDAAMMPVGGAVITAAPTGEVHYNDPNSGLPKAQPTSTAPDGIGYVMNVPAGQVMVGATKSGSTFHAHSINVRADKVTLTLVTP